MTLNVTFFNGTRENKSKSREAGRPIFDDVEMVKIGAPGERLTQVIAPAHERHRFAGEITTYAKRFPDIYAKFRAEMDQSVAGTPISEAPFLTDAKRRELKAINVHVIEQLAELGDGGLRMLGPAGRQYQADARAYLERASATVAEREKREVMEQLEALRAELAELKAGKTKPEPETEAGVAPLPDGPRGFSSFAEMSNADLRTYIKENTGEAPKGNPSRETLLARAEAVYAEAEAA